MQIDLAPKRSKDREKVKRERRTDRPMDRQNKLITAHVKKQKTKIKFKANFKKKHQNP